MELLKYLDGLIAFAMALVWFVTYWRLRRLRAAVTRHRDARGDNRCWLDDAELYRELDGDYDPAIHLLPPKTVFMSNCERFWAKRHNAVGYQRDKAKAIIDELTPLIERGASEEICLETVGKWL